MMFKIKNSCADRPNYKWCVWLLSGCIFGNHAASAAPINISYSLTSSAKVSLNIYDSSGKIVRELLHTAGRTSGTKTETWDGRDDAGNTLPAASYTWKMLATPGFGATYITNPGSNYKVDNTANFWAQSVGCHGGPQTVAVDSTGVYVSGGTENIETAVLKQPLTGSSRLWSAKNLSAWDAPASMAPVGATLYQRYQNGTIYLVNTSDGVAVSSFSATNGGENPSDMAANASGVIVCYPTAGLVRWLDATGVQTRSVSVPGATTVDVAADGTVYVGCGTTMRKITPTGTTSTVFVSGLTNIIRAAVNPTNGAVYLIDGPTYGGTQVKRYSSAGALLNTYGAAGGRLDGAYAAQKVNFKGTTDIAVESNGNFWVAEALSAPRRVARFNSSGTWLSEYYGGQAWAPWVFPEPDNLNFVWMGSSWGSMIRCAVNYSSKTWSVDSTYQYQGMADGLIDGHDNGAVWEGRMHGSDLYICRVNGAPEVFKVDRVNSKLIPVAKAIDGVSHDPGRYPQWIIDAAAVAGKSWLLWTDANGDGRPLNTNGTIQTNEIQYMDPINHGNATTVDKDLNYIFYRDGDGIQKYNVTSWNSVGAPVYGNLPNSTTFAPPPPRMVGGSDPRWSTFIAGDASGNVWGAFNPNITGWGGSTESFVARWNSSGTLQWQAGRKGNMPGNLSTLRRIYGVINNGTGSDCMVVSPFSYEWTAEGATPVYVYDQDGLYAGQIIGQPLNTSVANWKYGLGAEALSGTINKDTAGNVYLFGHWINEARVYKITGWTGWKRSSGTVAVPAAYTYPAFTPEVIGPNGTGTGLYSQYWTNSTFSGTPVTTGVEAAPGNAGLDLTFTTPPTGTTTWSARWTGTITPRRTGWHMFNQDRGYGSPNMVYVNGVNVNDAHMDNGWPSAQHNGPGRIVWLTAGTAYPITVENRDWYGMASGVHLQWSEPETNGAYSNVPTTQLVPVVPTPVPTPTPTPSA